MVGLIRIFYRTPKRDYLEGRRVNATKASHPESGLVSIEMALLLPLLLLLTFGVIEYGWMFLKSQQLTNAARQGARVGATVDATNADVLAAVNTIMNDSGMGGSGYTVNIAPAVGGLPTGLTLTVTVSLTYANVDLTGVPIIPLPVTLSSSTSMAKEGP